MVASWNSYPLELTSQILGWVAFCSWASCSVPQIILNFRRKSVVGLNFDYVVLNITKQLCYLIYNLSFYFSSAVQKQYHDQYGINELIPVGANDVAFSIHVVLAYLFILVQIFLYDRGNQKVSDISLTVVSAAWVTAGICVIIALPSHAWLWLIYVFNNIQVVMTVIKYAPQAYMNFSRKSTHGFSIAFVFLDILGDITNLGQMAVQSVDQGSFVNFYTNMGKVALCMVCMVYDLILICQHFLLYPHEKSRLPLKHDLAGKEPLLESKVTEP